MDFGFAGADKIAQMLPWVFGATGLFILLFISLKVWRALFGKKVKSIGLEAGMKFQDIDTLRTKGLVSDEEYRNIRHALAKREMERTVTDREAELDRQLLQEVAVNPDAARKFLVSAEATAKPGAPPPPAMNNPRVVQARKAAQTLSAEGEEKSQSAPRDIDVLLAKGAITQEEYARLKKFFE
jgi:hypothetical protein